MKVTVRKNRVRVDGQFTNRAILDAKCIGSTIGNGYLLFDMKSTKKKSLSIWFNRHMKSWVKQVKQDRDSSNPAIQIGTYYKEKEDQFFGGIDDVLSYPQNLYDYQKKIVYDMISRRCNVLGADMGTGKSVMAASISKILSIERTIIVCPTQLKWNWYHELTERWGFESIYITILDRQRQHSIKAFLEEQFVIVNYEQVLNNMKYLTRDFSGHIIADEVHKLKNPKTDKHKAFQKLISSFPKSKVTLMSGTLITNRINDLFGYLRLTGHELGNNHAYFNERYVRRHKSKIVGAKNIHELKFRLSNMFIRIKAEECLDLPPLSIMKTYFAIDDLSDDYRKEFEKLKQHEEELKYIDDELNHIRSKPGKKSNDDKETINALSQRKFVLSGEIRGNLFTMCRITAIGKAPRICEMVESIIDEGRKVIVFSTYHDPMDYVQKYFGDKCVRIDGSVNSLKRDRLVQRFLHDEHCKVFIGQNTAAGVGINLVNSSDVIFMDLPVTPDNLEQPYKRSHRIGQKHHVNVYYTIAKHTIDERVYDLIEDKINDIIEVFDKGKKGVVDYSGLDEKLVKDVIR